MKHKPHHPNLQTYLIWQVWNRSKPMSSFLSLCFPVSWHLVSCPVRSTVRVGVGDVLWIEGLLRAGKCEVDMASLGIESTNWTIREARETKQNKTKKWWFQKHWSLCLKLGAAFHGVKEMRNHCRMGLWQRHRLKSVLGPADFLSVSYAVAHPELRHGVQLLRTGFLPRT